MTRCPRCDGAYARIKLTLDGRDVTMLSCSTCDVRLWETDDGVTDIAAVLGREPMRQPSLR